MNLLRLFSVFVLLTQVATAKQTKIDSLALLSQSEDPYTKATNSLLLVKELSKSDSLAAHNQYNLFLKTDLSELEDSNYRELIKQHVLYLHSNFNINNSISVLRESMLLSKKREDSISIGLFHQLLSDSYLHLSNIDSSSHHLNIAEKIYKSINMVSEIGPLAIRKSNISYQKGEYEKAIEQAFSATEVLKKAKSKKYLPTAYMQLGNIFFFLNDFAEAKAYYSLSAKAFKTLKNNLGFHLVNSNMGLSLIEEEKHSESIPILLDAYQYFNKVGKHRELGSTSGFLALAYFKMGYIDSAIFYNREALSISERIGNTASTAGETLVNAKIFLHKGKLKEAEKDAKHSFMLFNSLMDYNSAQKSAKVLSSIYEQLDLIDSSFKYLKISLIYEDSLKVKSNHLKKYAIRHHVQIEEVNYKRQLEEERHKMQHQIHDDQQDQKLLTAILIAIVSIALLIIAIIFLFRNKKLTKEIASNQTYIQEQLIIKESLLSEIHHRVKNNLQIISSMLSLQAQHVTDSKLQKTINDCKGRISSMSLIHEGLYKKVDGEEALFSTYIRNLLPRLIKTYQIDESKIKLKMDLEDIQLHLDESIPCGLIINEIVSNSFKHAFQNKENGEIKVNLKKEQDIVQITIADNGPGLKESIDFDSKNGFGFLLIDTLTKQLEAKLEIESFNKMEYKLSFISKPMYAS